MSGLLFTSAPCHLVTGSKSIASNYASFWFPSSEIPRLLLLMVTVSSWLLLLLVPKLQDRLPVITVPPGFCSSWFFLGPIWNHPLHATSAAATLPSLCCGFLFLPVSILNVHCNIPAKCNNCNITVDNYQAETSPSMSFPSTLELQGENLASSTS